MKEVDSILTAFFNSRFFPAWPMIASNFQAPKNFKPEKVIAELNRKWEANGPIEVYIAPDLMNTSRNAIYLDKVSFAYFHSGHTLCSVKSRDEKPLYSDHLSAVATKSSP